MIVTLQVRKNKKRGEDGAGGNVKAWVLKKGSVFSDAEEASRVLAEDALDYANISVAILRDPEEWTERRVVLDDKHLVYFVRHKEGTMKALTGNTMKALVKNISQPESLVKMAPKDESSKKSSRVWRTFTACIGGTEFEFPAFPAAVGCPSVNPVSPALAPKTKRKDAPVSDEDNFFGSVLDAARAFCGTFEEAVAAARNASNNGNPLARALCIQNPFELQGMMDNRSKIMEVFAEEFDTSVPWSIGNMLFINHAEKILIRDHKGCFGVQRVATMPTQKRPKKIDFMAKPTTPLSAEPPTEPCAAPDADILTYVQTGAALSDDETAEPEDKTFRPKPKSKKRRAEDEEHSSSGEEDGEEESGDEDEESEEEEEEEENEEEEEYVYNAEDEEEEDEEDDGEASRAADKELLQKNIELQAQIVELLKGISDETKIMRTNLLNFGTIIQQAITSGARKTK